MPRRDSGRVPWRGLGAAGLYAGNSKRSSRRRPIWRCATITGIRVRHLNLVLPGKTTKTGRACSHCDANSLRTRFSVAGDEPKRPGRLDHSMQATVQQNEAGPSADLGQTVRQATRSAKAASALRGESCYGVSVPSRSEEHTSELQSRQYLVCRLLLEKKKKTHLYFLLLRQKNKKQFKH